MTPDVADLEEREHSRNFPRTALDLMFRALRTARAHAHSFVGAVGIFLVGGFSVAVVGTAIFAGLADEVREGATQAFDDSILRWVGTYRRPLLDSAMLEVTALGTGLVVLAIVTVAALFLFLTRHRYSALLLLVSTGGGLLLNTILKLGFSRPRPQVVEWGTHAVSSSFPSGHAMSSAIVYGTVAYLAARLQRRRWARWLTMAIALTIILLISSSRIYLGVHYPSDVAAGMLIGLAWAGFCMATLEAIQRYGKRGSTQVLEHEEPAPPHQH